MSHDIHTSVYILFIRSDVCKFESGVLPFESQEPKSLTFDAFEDHFGRPLASLGPVHIGDKLKIYCVEKGDLFALIFFPIIKTLSTVQVQHFLLMWVWVWTRRLHISLEVV